jgi:hypothetical protein
VSRLRTTAAALAIAGAAVAAAAWPGGDAPPTPECVRAPVPPAYAVNLATTPGRRVWRCTLPTPGRSAVVYLTGYEDGSGRGAFLDPDPRR